MIKLNFEFDSKDSTSLQFMNWLSAFPLDQSSIKITTSVDCVDPKTNESHRIGNIILDISANDGKSVLALPAKEPVCKTEEEEKPKAPQEPVEEAKNTQNTEKNDKPVAAKAKKPRFGVFSRSASKPKPAAAIQKTDEPSFDESILAAVSLTEEEAPAQPKLTETVSEKPETEAASVSEEVTENELEVTFTVETVEPERDIELKEAEVAEATEAEETKSEETQPVNQGSEDFDYLLNSLNEFNA